MNTIIVNITIVLGGITLVCGFGYAIYESYFQKSSNDEESTDTKIK